MTHKEALYRVKGYLTDIIPTENYSEVEEIIKALKQQPCRDMEEIREVISCDADTETKCKMISYILTAKPHYFEKQTVQDKQAESEKYQKAFEDGYANGYAQARFDYEQEPCDDAISREAVMRLIENKPYDWSNLTERHNMLMEIRKLPSVTQQTGEWIHIGGDEWICSKCGEVITTEGSWDKPTDKYCKECGVKIQELEDGNNN